MLILTRPGFSQDTDSGELIRLYCENIRNFRQLTVGENPIAMIDVIAEFYERRDFALAWNDQEKSDDLLKVIDESEQVGLRPEDYHRTALLSYKNIINSFDAPPAKLKTEFDVLLTDALLRMIYHWIFGKVDPSRMDPNWNIYREVNDIDPPEFIETILRAPSLYDYIYSLRKTDLIFVRLVKELGRYRDIAAKGGWPTVPAGPVIKADMSDQRIPLIRKRLLVTHDLKIDQVDDSLVYDQNLQDAVKNFQLRHGLDQDGVIGKGTITAMNIPVADKIDQIRVNIERLRWVLNETEEDFILVNIANFRTSFVRENELEWTGRSQVGKPFRQTPVFKADLKYLVINPTWTVPPTILKKDVLPAIKRDLNYLKKKNMKIINKSGKVIDPSSIDWTKYNGGNFPYAIRQDPGPTNALGRIKFIFPNKHFVFLHDTPSKALFERKERSFSSGCIRVENPFQLALHLLKNEAGNWDMKKIDEILASSKTKTIHLKEDLAVYLLYFTAFPDIDDEQIFYFRSDIYQRDQKILEDLNSEFRLLQRHEAARE
jgi:murein L,D-transpeptidase YcbB/YkuD